MLSYFLYGLFFVSCLVLIVTVLLQPGKTDAGALFTSNVSSTAFGPRGTQSVLSRITIGAAITFMVSALLLSFPAIIGNISVLQTTTESAAEVKSVATDANTANVSNIANVTNATVVTNSNVSNAAPANTNTNK